MAKSIIEALVDERQSQEKEVQVKAKVTEGFEEKINFICNHYGIKVDDYLGKILEKSEIAKVYAALKKPQTIEKEND